MAISQQFKEEVLDAYVQLQNLCLQVKHRRGSMSVTSSTSSEDTQLADVRVGLLTDALKQLKGLLHDILRKEAKGVNISRSGGGGRSGSNVNIKK